MNKVLGTVTAIAVAIAPVWHFAPHASKVAPHAPAHVCTAELIPFEDGTWEGGDLIYDGKILDHRWDLRMPKWTWTPGVNGVECTLIIAKIAGGRG